MTSGTISVDCTPNEIDWGRFDKFLEFDLNGGCWLWAGALSIGGYGVFGLSKPKRTGYAHRVSYSFHVGRIPDELELDHLCRVRSCCNPAHLEPVTTKENLSRIPGFNGDKTHCPRGHEYTPENTFVQIGGRKGYAMRQCKACRNEKMTARYRADPKAGAAKRKAAYEANPESRERKRLYMLEYNKRKRAKPPQ